jgi:hypothetical protein
MFTYTYDWTMSSILVNDLEAFGDIDFKSTETTLFWNINKQLGSKYIGNLSVFDYTPDLLRYINIELKMVSIDYT